jgi:hypothetical protein
MTIYNLVNMIKTSIYKTRNIATLHPNPTSGLVTIMGENLKQAEACNMLGQQVLSVQGKAMNFTSTWLNCPQASISSPSPMRKVGNVYVR